MKTSSSILNPFAVSYVPVAKRKGLVVDKECQTTSLEASVKDLKLNDHVTDDAHGTSDTIPQELSDFIDEESEMALAYLQMVFPGVSDEFLIDVYNVNRGDLEGAIDMLWELESPSTSTDDQQKDSKITNTAENVSPGECSLVKVDESSTSSGSSNVTVATS